ncbi:DoxX family protein [Pluralibacter gergoviae]|uniref:DoxX family protein n=1 Tax=Pluralibacter gergoviae TaxID=61647 RepID=A0A089PML4_PLUGE|nr:DoxX family protein [Pluralibacter gergoviae]AIR01492.1 DoxX family protein [Pluralibacter gergoviae]KJM63516.1 DoxX family protein [Pluralibacter gergoviae]KMK13255.1 DoxX family protein [Pluralibacter gergoviae]KMK19602.1 DoxX family protein [Pluralibacter gergoviae]KMK23455.1 DoxX family protein [Pluralibacter gergoviae]
MDNNKAFFSLLARIMAVGLFFTSGVDKIFNYGSNLDLMASNGVPGFFLPLVILLEVGGGLAIACGFLTRFTSLFMAVFSVLAGFLFYQGYSHAHLMVWLKNISCAAGFVLLCVHGGGKWSIDYWLQRQLKRPASH